MTEACGCPPEAGPAVCELSAPGLRRSGHVAAFCPECGQMAKPVQEQTVRAGLSVSLREVPKADYLFCRTPACPIVYFSFQDGLVFTVQQVRERVYQKVPEADEVFVCYCFRHTIHEIRAAAPEKRAAIVDDINNGINAGQCACDVRNPQGSCCLGNVRAVIRRLEKPVADQYTGPLTAAT